MKTKKKFFMAVLVMLFSVTAMQAQTYEWQKAIQDNESQIGNVFISVNGGRKEYFEDGDLCYSNYKEYSNEQLYSIILDEANRRYSALYPNYYLRDFKSKHQVTKRYVAGDIYEYTYYVSATAVIPLASQPKTLENPLTKAIDKALLEVRESSRIAIDQIKVPTGTDKEEYKDQVVEILLDKGFKVVAKEYLERLYEEQLGQQSGIYNDKTTVQENNFSAVGYYLNVKLTETSLRVQIINVSTGEYEGNVTIKLQK